MEKATSAETGAARFSVETLPSSRRYAAWQASIACIFDVWQTPTQRLDDRFSATLTSRLLGPLMVARTHTSTQHWRRNATNIARDGMDHFMIQLYEEGTQICDRRDRAVDMPERGLLVYDLSREMEAVSSDLVNHSLVIPRARLAPLLAPGRDHHLRAIAPNAPLAGVLRDHIRALSCEIDRLGPAAAAPLADATVLLVAACLDMGAEQAENVAATAPARLLAARRIIARHLTDPGLGPDLLARKMQLSPGAVDALLAPLGGVAAFIEERRLAAAAELVIADALPRRPIDEIARRFQFDPSAFSRAFRRHFGLSPRAARHSGTLPPLRHREWLDPKLDRRYESWLHRLAA